MTATAHYPFANREQLELQAKAKLELERRAKKQRLLSSTLLFSQWTGSNRYDKAAGRYPWTDIQEEIATYLDDEETGLPLPIKFVAIPRSCLKTEVACQALARRVLLYPERRNLIVGATEARATMNLGNIVGHLTSDKAQELWGDEVLPGPDDDRWTIHDAEVIREGNYREPTIKTAGRGTSTTGDHYNGVIWFDDLITDKDNFARNQHLADEIMDLLSHIVDAVADPGCEIWITCTRYHPRDPYGRIIAEDSDYNSMLVKPIINRTCYQRGMDPDSGPLYPFRHCIKLEDQIADVEFRGEVYPDVKRRSLEDLQKRSTPQFFYSQYLNMPLISDTQVFEDCQFDHVLPIEGPRLEQWLDNPKNRADANMGEGEPMPLITYVLGDPSFRSGRRNDYAVLWVVSQTATDQWIVVDGFYERLGYGGDERYADKALEFKKRYNARGLAIEMHAKETLETVFRYRAGLKGMHMQITPLPNNSNVKKPDRIATIIPLFQDHRVYFCKNVDRMRKILRDQAMTFPACCDGHGMHDDALDALANGTQVFKTRSAASNWTHMDTAPERDKLSKGVFRWVA